MSNSNAATRSEGGINLFAIAWHILALAVFTYAFQRLDFLSEITGVDIDAMFAGHYQFLTILALWISRLGMGTALLGDLLPSNFKLVRTIKTLVCVAALPIETLVSLLYWSIMSINPALLAPPRNREDPSNPAQMISETVRIPLSIDLAMHFAPAIFLLVVSRLVDCAELFGCVSFSDYFYTHRTTSSSRPLFPKVCGQR
jgi:hypothetical protein